MTRIEKSIEIKVPPAKAWEMLAFDRMAEWLDEVKSVQYTSEVRTPEDKYRVGASGHVAEKHVKYDIEMMESIKNEKIVVLSKNLGWGKVTMSLTYALEPVGEGTKLTYVMEYNNPWFFGKTMDRMFGTKHAEKGVERSLNNLKRILEK